MGRTRRTPPEGEPQKKAKPKRESPPQDGKPEKRSYLTMVERVRLAQRIAKARAKPKPDTWAVIAKREGHPARTCQDVLSRYEHEMARLGDNTGRETLEKALLLYSEAIEKAALEAEQGETSAARVGALRTMLDAQKGEIELLAVMGRMPRSFRALDELALLQRLVRRLADVASQHELPPEVIHEFIGIIQEMQPVIEGSAQAALPKAS